MPDYRAKGDMFRGLLKQVARRWGRRGLEAIGRRPDEYMTEQWYDLADFCGLLETTRTRLGNGSPLVAYQLGLGMMKEDDRWPDIFQGMNPVEIFTSVKRQEGQHAAGSQSMSVMGPKHLRIEVAGECIPDIWFEFYRGRLQGVLELTGRTGVVHMLPGGDGKRTYDIRWG